MPSRDSKKCSSDWMESKRFTISPKDNVEKGFQYSITVTLNHENNNIKN